MRRWRTWRAAMGEALYGPEGFFRREAPADHFRTSVHASPLFAAALARLARAYGLSRIVDLGSGRGELLNALQARDPSLELLGVELADRPAGLAPTIGWTDRLPPWTGALVVANEWLDNVPLDIAELDEHRTVRLVEVDPTTGDERLGPPASPDDLAWLERWWPLAHVGAGDRAEIGRARDDAWSEVVRLTSGCVLLAIDYGHDATNRPSAPLGSLIGYRSGSPTPPIPDGSCDLTAHVAFDAVRAAAEAAGARTLEDTTQAKALAGLGISAARPAIDLARRDPRAYLTELNRAGEASELLSPTGLGGFRWLLQRSP